MTDNKYRMSYLADQWTGKSVPVEMEQVVNEIRTSERLRTMTEAYRASPSDRIKERLPRVTVATMLSGEGKSKDDVIGFTGLVPLDFDHLPPEVVAVAKGLICADEHVVECNESISQHGLHVAVPYVAAEGCTLSGEELFSKAFVDINTYFSELVGQPYDEQCANINRTLSLSHDPEVYFNPDAVAFVICDVDFDFDDDFVGHIAPEIPDGIDDFGGNNTEREAPNNMKQPQTRPNGHWVKVPKDKIRATEEFAQKRGMQYVEHNRHNYMVFCVFHMNKLGVPRSEAERWLSQFSDRKELEKRSVLKSIYDRHSQEFGTYDEPYEWEWEPAATKTKTKTKTKTGGEMGENLQTDKLTGASQAHTCARESDVTELKVNSLPDYQWPHFIQQMVDCGDSKPQRDVILLSVITVLGAMIGKLLRFKYSHRFWFPSLQLFVVAPPASGKSVIGWVRRLAEPLHDSFMAAYDKAKADYDREKVTYDVAGKERINMECPKQPTMRMFLISGNNTGTGILENLADAHQNTALICEAEADTISAAIQSDYGCWDDTLRRVHDHERLSYNRRTNKEFRQIPNPFLSVLISGTPAQVKPLIPSAENGLFSRQIFATLPAIDEFIDQFGDSDEKDYDTLFTQWGREWTERLGQIRTQMSCVELCLNQEQRDAFNQHFSMLFHHAGATHHNHHMKSSVVREAINVLRMMSVVAFFRALEDDKGFSIPADVPEENVKDGVCARYDLSITEADFQAVLSLSEPLYHNAGEVLSLLPSTEAVRTVTTPVETLLTSLPLQFSRAEAVAIGAELGITRDNVDQLLHRLCDDQRLIKAARGKYEFAFPCKVKSKHES